MDNSDYKICEVCGKVKHVSDFSKSYKNRCKKCVAEQTREIRSQNNGNNSEFKENRSQNTGNRSEWIKAVVKGTEETLTVRHCSEPINVKVPMYETKEGRRIPMYSLQFEKEIDWEQRRYEIARDIFTFRQKRVNENTEFDARYSIKCANVLIEELKKGESL